MSVNLTWGRHIMYSPGAKREAAVIRRDIRRCTARPDTYLIVMPKDGAKPEMYHNTVLFSESYAGREFMIVGIAEGRSEAVKLFAQMIEDVYKKDPKLNYAEYFAGHS